MSDQPKPNCGGPAFPRATTLNRNTGQPWNEEQPGMSLRDWFAGMALQGMIAWSAGLEITKEQFATSSYALADAMLKERHQ